MLLGLLRANWLPLALAATAGLFAWLWQAERTSHAVDLTKWANERTAYATAAREAEVAQRRIEDERRNAVDAAKAELDSALAENRRLVATLDIARLDVGRVRNQLATFAAGRGQAGADSIAACQDRAAALATSLAGGVELLDQGRRILVSVAGERDDLAAQVIACVKAWPAD